MIEIRTTTCFEAWLEDLRDQVGKRRVLARIDRLRMGNPGDSKSVGGTISEMRIDCGPGYRVYFTRRGSVLVILLCGGDKSTQQSDIRQAHRLADNLDME